MVGLRNDLGLDTLVPKNFFGIFNLEITFVVFYFFDFNGITCCVPAAEMNDKQHFILEIDPWNFTSFSRMLLPKGFPIIGIINDFKPLFFDSGKHTLADSFKSVSFGIN